jgi:hypothetical protein
MTDQAPIRWWSMRHSQSKRSPGTYRCPLCHGYLPAITPHALIAPEADLTRRRHAHLGCVMRERKAGRLPTRDEWQATQPRPPSLWRRLRKGGRVES